MRPTEIHALWRALHHNASLLGYDMDLRNDYESALFNDWMNFSYVEAFLDSLYEDCKEKFHLDLHFYQYGRSGATIAPEEWIANGRSGDFGPFADDLLEEIGEDVVADVLIWINDTIDEALKGLKEEWKYEKDARGITDEMLARYDNAREVVYQARRWVDKTTHQEIEEEDEA